MSEPMVQVRNVHKAYIRGKQTVDVLHGLTLDIPSGDFVALMDKLTKTTDPAARSALLKEAQEMIAKDYVNAYLFQLAKTGVANARIEGLWENSPTQANDLTAVHWVE